MKRQASHAGSWYSDVDSTLRGQIVGWLGAAKQQRPQRLSSDIAGRAKAVIVPHAGYRYSASTAAAAYQYLSEAVNARPELKRIVVLGPSHHLSLSSCALPTSASYNTPLGDILIDSGGIQTLRKAAAGIPGLPTIETLRNSDDEEEHSIEMQLPFIHHIMTSAEPPRSWTLLPVLGAPIY